MRLKITRAVLTALVLSLLAIPRVHAAGPATGVTITPSAATITADQTQTFVVRTTNADGTTTDVTSAATLSVNDPLGSISGATYSAGKVGTWNVQASYQSFNATADMTVTAGAVASLDINPKSDPEYTIVGKDRKFSVDGFDQDNNRISDVSVTWSVIGEIGTITENGAFTPTNVGTGKVQAQSGTITDQVAVIVSTAPTTNTNTDSNVNGSVNTNTTVNTNIAVNTNTANTNALDTNTAQPTEDSNTNVPVITIAADDTTDAGQQCTTMKSWLWVLLLIAALAAFFFLYWLVPATKFWPVVVALVGAGVLTFVQRRYGCDGQGWWAWVMIIGTVAISLVAVRQSTPKKPLP